MALPLSNSFESGIASGVPITVANSDDGTAGDGFQSVDVGFTFDDAHPARGTLAGKCTQLAVPTFRFIGWNSTVFGTGKTTVWGRVYYYATAHPANQFNWLALYASGFNWAGGLDVTTTSRLAILDGAFANRGTTTNAMTLDALNRIEFAYVAGPAGWMEVKLFLGDAVVPVETKTSTAANFENAIQEGGVQMNATAANHVFWFDDLQFNDVAYPGPSLPVGTGVGRMDRSMFSKRKLMAA